MSLDLYEELAKELCETRNIAKQMFWRHMFKVSFFGETPEIKEEVMVAVIRRVADSGCPRCKEYMRAFELHNHQAACTQIYAKTKAD